jgi:FkbM family methyltransferase
MPHFWKRLAFTLREGYVFDRLRARLTRRPHEDIDRIVSKVLGRMSKPVIFEFGVFDGDVSRKLCGFLPDGFSSYYAWEPDPRSLQKIKSKGLPAGVELVEAAVGATNGTAVFHLSGQASCTAGDVSGVGSSLRRPLEKNAVFFPWMTFGEKVEVPVFSLDSFCERREVKHIDFIWADVQGAERDLIEGGRRILENTKVMFLEQEGYRLYEGQWLFPEMMRILGRDWKLACRFPSDVLIYNSRLTDPALFA